MFEYLLESLSALRAVLGDSPLLFSVAVGLTITLVVLATLYLIATSVDPVRRRVLSASGSNATVSSRASRIDRSLAPIKPFIVPTKGKELSAIRQRLTYAGFRSNESVTVYYAIKLLLILVLAILGAGVSYAWPGSTTTVILGVMGAGAFTGIVLPSYYLDKKIDGRRTEIINGFPDVLDLIVACTEAGLGLNDAIQRVARETEMMFPVLSAELALVNSQIRTGVDRVEALNGLAERTGIEEIKGFVSMVNQSVRFGTSIAETLRVFAEEFRDRRMQRAEEAAAKVGTKLLFPLVLCIFPSFFVVAIGPAVISIIRVFEKM